MTYSLVCENAVVSINHEPKSSEHYVDIKGLYIYLYWYE